jgi:hypothetical protein
VLGFEVRVAYRRPAYRNVLLFKAVKHEMRISLYDFIVINTQEIHPKTPHFVKHETAFSFCDFIVINTQ